MLQNIFILLKQVLYDPDEAVVNQENMHLITIIMEMLYKQIVTF